ncbi:hypothetical protein F4778DRAFT_775422 [Xylariomycetidae sp. FL2044]|nr:hypothetical protein F4778DRAFT_775422 [Xylariomycetidae sp. FL2044]
MAGLPDGWEWDYDGARWFYRYKPTGLTQFNFPKPGDEFPEFVAAGVGSINLAPEDRLAIEQQIKCRGDGSSIESDKARKTSASKENKISGNVEEHQMSATGYFDPESFMYFGPASYKSASPVTSEKGGAIDESRFIHVDLTAGSPSLGTSEPVKSALMKGSRNSERTSEAGPSMLEDSTVKPQNSAYGLPATHEQVWSPVGLVSELGSSDTAKCAAELAPIELDATSFYPASSQIHLTPDGPVELPSSQATGKTPDTSQIPLISKAVDGYPLLSASFKEPIAETGGHPSDTLPIMATDNRGIPSDQQPEPNKSGILSHAWTPAKRIMYTKHPLASVKSKRPHDISYAF